MTMYDIYKLSKTLVALADGEPVKNYKGTVSKARDFIERYELTNDKYIRSNKYEV